MGREVGLGHDDYINKGTSKPVELEELEELEDIVVLFWIVHLQSLKNLAVSSTMNINPLWLNESYYASLHFHWISFNMSHFHIYSPLHICPDCNVTFPSVDHVIEHLNSKTSCWPQDSCTKRVVAFLAFIHGGKLKVKGPIIGLFHLTSGYIYGSAKNLIQLWM